MYAPSILDQHSRAPHIVPPQLNWKQAGNMSESIGVEPLARYIGALITGVDLREPLSPAQITAIRGALVEWKVIFFRDQPLSHDQHIAFARQFGELTVGHPVFGSVPNYPQIYFVAKSRFGTRFEGARLFKPWTGWHTDVTAAINPPAASILRGVTIPPYGGDTQWTSLEAAYDALSPTLRGFLETLRGEHRFTRRKVRRANANFTIR
jgi:taurine dioxygenase